MTIYTSKPQQVEAIEWRGDNWDEVKAFASRKVSAMYDHHASAHPSPLVGVQLLAGKASAVGWLTVPVGHWIARWLNDESDYWPIAPDAFAAKYEAGDTALPKLRKLEGWTAEHSQFSDEAVMSEVLFGDGEKHVRLAPGTHNWPNASKRTVTVTHHDIYVSDIPRGE